MLFLVGIKLNACNLRIHLNDSNLINLSFCREAVSHTPPNPQTFKIDLEGWGIKKERKGFNKQLRVPYIYIDHSHMITVFRLEVCLRLQTVIGSYCWIAGWVLRKGFQAEQNENSTIHQVESPSFCGFWWVSHIRATSWGRDAGCSVFLDFCHPSEPPKYPMSGGAVRRQGIQDLSWCV